MIKIIFSVFAILVLSACGRGESSSDPKNQKASANDAPVAQMSAASAAEMEAAAATLREMADAQEVNKPTTNAKKRKEDESSLTSKWAYEETRDPMTDAVTKTAILYSDNSLSLDFPYQGHNPGTIMVRQHPRYGVDAIIGIQKGQTLCLVTGCTVLIRFNEGKPTRFHANGPADHSSETVFLTNAAGFISSARKANKIRVILPLYQGGDQVLEFTSPLPLEWAPANRRATK